MVEKKDKKSTGTTAVLSMFYAFCGLLALLILYAIIVAPMFFSKRNDRVIEMLNEGEFVTDVALVEELGTVPFVSPPTLKECDSMDGTREHILCGNVLYILEGGIVVDYFDLRETRAVFD